MQEFGCDVSVHDPLAESKEALHEYGISLVEWNALPNQAEAIVAAVPHDHYNAQPVSHLLNKLKPGGVFIDIKSSYSPAEITAAGFVMWRL